MKHEFTKITSKNETRYILETASSGATGAGSIASTSGVVGGVQKRNKDNLLAQEAEKNTLPAAAPRNFVAKNAKMGGAGAHRDKKKEQKQGKEKHRKPFDMAEGTQEVDSHGRTKEAWVKAVHAKYPDARVIWSDDNSQVSASLPDGKKIRWVKDEGVFEQGSNDTAAQRKAERDKQRTSPAKKQRDQAQRKGITQDKDGTYYAKEGVAEGSTGWHPSSTVKNPNFNDELSSRRVSPPGKRTKAGKLSADEKGAQDRTKALMKHTQKKGGLTGPKGHLPEGAEPLDPDLYEEADPEFIASVVKRVLPTANTEITEEGLVEVSTDDGLYIAIGLSIAEGGYSINLSGGAGAASAGAERGRITTIIKAVGDAAVREYGTPSKKTSLSIDNDHGHGVWQHIAQKLGYDYEAQSVAEDDAGDFEQRVLAKIEKEKQRLAKLKQTDPEAYKREIAKRKTSTKIPPVSAFEQQGVAEGSGPQKGDPVYYGSRLVGWFLGYSKLGKVITEPNYDEMGDEYTNRDVYWDKDAVTIKSDKQGVAEVQELDHEISMASNELLSIADNAKHLLDLVRRYSEMEGLEAWQQSKITKAADYLNSVLNSLKGEEEFDTEDHTGFDKGWGQGSYDTYAGGNHGRGVAEGNDEYMESLAQSLEAAINEKAVSKAQQRFMGMVHAAKKGEKPASPEVAKVAKGISSKEAEKYASTKHKGLPEKKPKK